MNPPRERGRDRDRVRNRGERDRPRREAAPRANGRAHTADFDDLPGYTVSEAPAVVQVSAPVAVVAPLPVVVPALVVAPAPEAPVRERESAERSEKPERTEDGDFAPARDGIAEIYVSIGRRDGARPSDIQTVLEQSGLLAEQTDYIRVRQRNTFVGVKTEYLEKAVSALNGAAIAGKPAFAEPARQRD